MKQCNWCKQDQPAKTFNKTSGMCKKCHDRDKRYRKNYHRDFGLEAYLQLLAHQNGKCLICEREEAKEEQKFHVDHRMEGNDPIIRGILCHLCNKGLGCFGDIDEKRLTKTLDYVKIDGINSWIKTSLLISEEGSK